jgi:hypothetical protein
MTTTPTVHNIAHRQVVRAASHPHVLYTQPAIEAATALLEDWLRAAAVHEVPAVYRPELASQLASTALQAVTAPYRATIPDQDRAIVLLDAVATILRGRGVDSGRDGFEVPVPRTPTSPAWGPTGTSRLLITCTDAGWGLTLDMPGSLVVDVEASHDPDSATAVVDLALAVVRGELGDPFKAR